MQIAQTDFSSDCMKMTQEYLMYFKEFSCKMAENMQARCVPRFIQCFHNAIFDTTCIFYTMGSVMRVYLSITLLQAWGHGTSISELQCNFGKC